MAESMETPASRGIERIDRNHQARHDHPPCRRERVHFYFVGDAAHDGAFEEGRRQAHETYASVLAEDIPVCEALRRGRTSEGFTGGVLSPFRDRATFELAERVRERLG